MTGCPPRTARPDARSRSMPRASRRCTPNNKTFTVTVTDPGPGADPTVAHTATLDFDNTADNPAPTTAKGLRAKVESAIQTAVDAQGATHPLLAGATVQLIETATGYRFVVEPNRRAREFAPQLILDVTAATGSTGADALGLAGTGVERQRAGLRRRLHARRRLAGRRRGRRRRHAARQERARRRARRAADRDVRAREDRPLQHALHPARSRAAGRPGRCADRRRADVLRGAPVDAADRHPGRSQHRPGDPRLDRRQRELPPPELGALLPARPDRRPARRVPPALDRRRRDGGRHLRAHRRDARRVEGAGRPRGVAARRLRARLQADRPGERHAQPARRQRDPRVPDPRPGRLGRAHARRAPTPRRRSGSTSASAGPP